MKKKKKAKFKTVTIKVTPILPYKHCGQVWYFNFSCDYVLAILVPAKGFDGFFF